MKAPVYYRKFNYDKALIANKYLASLEEGVSTIDQAKTKSGSTIGYPGWNLIYNILLSHLHPENFNIILETGTNYGCTTIILAQSLKDSGCLGKVFTVELDKNSYEIALTNFQKAGVAGFIEATNADSRNFLKDFARAHSSIRIAFLDASHLFNDVITEFETILPLLGPQSLVIFDNTYLIADEQEDQRVNGALREILQRHGGNLVNFETVSWCTPGIAIWQKSPFDSLSLKLRDGERFMNKLDTVGKQRKDRIVQLYSQAHNLVVSADYKRALELFDRIITDAPPLVLQTHQINYERAICLTALGRICEAEQAVRSALSVSTDNPGTLKLLSEIQSIKQRNIVSNCGLEVRPVASEIAKTTKVDLSPFDEKSEAVIRARLAANPDDVYAQDLLVAIQAEQRRRNYERLLKEFVGKRDCRQATLDFRHFLMCLDLEDKSSLRIIARHAVNLLEPFEISLFSEMICRNPGSLIVDVGANYGLYTLHACDLGRSNIVRGVVAVEPDRRCFGKLAESVRTNGFQKKVLLVNKAISDSDGQQVDLFINEGGSFDNRTFTDGGIAFSDHYMVEMVTIDSIVAEVVEDAFKPNNIIVKIDIQGNEPRAFRGMVNTISNYPSIAVLFEFDPEMMESEGFDPFEFAHEVFALGFDNILNINEISQSLEPFDGVKNLTKVIRQCKSMGHRDPRRYTNILCCRNVNVPQIIDVKRRLQTTRPIVSKSILETDLVNDSDNIEVQNSKWLRFNPSKREMREGKQLFFVTGRSKSGNTWLSLLLNSHPQIFCDRTENNAFHQDMNLLFFGQPTVSLHEKVGTFYEKRFWNLTKNGLIANLIQRCEKDTAIRLGDKTPRQDIEKILAAFPETQIVVTIRDFRDALVSLAFHQQRNTGTWKGVFPSEGLECLDNNFIEESLSTFEKHGDIEKYLDYSKKLPAQVLIVRYEDLKLDTVNTLRMVLSFLKVDSSCQIAEKCVEKNSFEKLSGGRKVGEEDPNSFFRKGVMGDWRNYFNEENIEVFKKYGRRSLVLAGYEKDDTWTL